MATWNKATNAYVKSIKIIFNNITFLLFANFLAHFILMFIDFKTQNQIGAGLIVVARKIKSSSLTIQPNFTIFVNQNRFNRRNNHVRNS